jgi:hypothetical protein
LPARGTHAGQLGEDGLHYLLVVRLLKIFLGEVCAQRTLYEPGEAGHRSNAALFAGGERKVWKELPPALLRV